MSALYDFKHMIEFVIKCTKWILVLKLYDKSSYNNDTNKKNCFHLKYSVVYLTFTFVYTFSKHIKQGGQINITECPT